MLLGSSAWHSTWYKLIWKAQVTERKHMYFRLVPSALSINESESLLWPTPTATDGGSGRINRSASPHAKARPTLAMMARKGLWPTPTHRDYKSGTGAQARSGHQPPLTDVLPGNLNPEWVEALMGLPIGWTALSGPLPKINRKRRGNQRGQ
jgi:hypothetical protein